MERMRKKGHSVFQGAIPGFSGQIGKHGKYILTLKYIGVNKTV
jgi:hypothetical protein